MQLCCCLISKFIATYPSLDVIAAPGGPRPSALGVRIASTKRTIEVYETSHYRQFHARQCALAESRIQFRRFLLHVTTEWLCIARYWCSSSVRPSVRTSHVDILWLMNACWRKCCRLWLVICVRRRSFLFTHYTCARAAFTG